MTHSRSSALQTLWKRLLDLIFPRRCAACGAWGDVWCERCDQKLQRIASSRCARCGSPDPGGALCGGCQSNALPLSIRSYARYAEPLVSAILMLKYQPNQELAARMAEWLHQLVLLSGWRADVVVPVPLGADRLRARGFNQAELLAVPLAARLELPEEGRLLKRVRETRSQVGLAPGDRWRNVQGAFQAEPELAHGREVLIVDDLCTTGATLSECALALHEAGSEDVFAVTVGRA